MALSMRALERNGHGGPIGGGRGHDRWRPQSPPPLPWLIVMFLAPPRSILMEPVVGGVTHDTINARHRLERARTAHRQKKEPKPLTPIVTLVFLAEALKKNTVCPVVKKRSRQIAKCGFVSIRTVLLSQELADTKTSLEGEKTEALLVATMAAGEVIYGLWMGEWNGSELFFQLLIATERIACAFLSRM
jgi:hypothetical protein